MLCPTNLPTFVAGTPLCRNTLTAPLFHRRRVEVKPWPRQVEGLRPCSHLPLLFIVSGVSDGLPGRKIIRRPFRCRRTAIAHYTLLAQSRGRAPRSTGWRGNRASLDPRLRWEPPSGKEDVPALVPPPSQPARLCPRLVPLCPTGLGQRKPMAGAAFRGFVPLSQPVPEVLTCPSRWKTYRNTPFFGGATCNRGATSSGRRNALPRPLRGFPLPAWPVVSPAGKDAHSPRYGPKNSPRRSGRGLVVVRGGGRLHEPVCVQKVLSRLAAYLGEPGGPIR